MHFFRSFALILLGLFFCTDIFAQSPADSLTAEQVEAIKSALKQIDKFNAYWEIGKYLTPLFAFILGGLGAYTYYRSRVEKWADNFINEQLKKEAAEWTMIKQIAKERVKVSGCKIAVVNADTGYRKELSDSLTGAGFPIPSFFTFEHTSDEHKKYFFSDKFDPEAYQFLIIDDGTGSLEEENVRDKILAKQKAAFQNKILWFTTSTPGLRGYDEYKDYASIVTTKERIVSTILSKL
jgi:hypothetical protein